MLNRQRLVEAIGRHVPKPGPTAARASRRKARPARGVSAAEIPRLSKGGGLQLEARRLLQGLLGGRHRSRELGASVDFAEHRPYQQGDDLRQIDWRAYARNDHLLIRRFFDERSLPLSLVLDVSASMRYGKPSKQARAQLAAAMLGLLAIDQGDDVRLFEASDRTERKHQRFAGPAAADRLCVALSNLPHRQATDLPACCRSLRGQLRRRSLVVLCSDLLCPLDEVAEGLAALHGCGHELVVLQFLHPDELALPSSWGRVLLVDPEGAVPMRNVHADRFTRDYAEAMRAHLAACRRICAAGHAEHLLIPTDRHLAATLGTWLRQRQRRR